MIYFTADTHFCHSNIINLSNRPFRDIDTMNKQLIQNWNAYVTDRDEIYILGDFTCIQFADEITDNIFIKN